LEHFRGIPLDLEDHLRCFTILMRCPRFSTGYPV
jgi:hypothetical protein